MENNSPIYSMENKDIKIGVILVLYATSEIKIKTEDLPDNSMLIVIDNTPDQNLNIIQDNIIYVPLFLNLGIAEAQNKGIEIAHDLKCTHIIFFDQDSIVQDHFIQRMVNEYERINNRISNLFLLGPNICL